MFNSCRSLHFVGVKLKIIYQAETVPGIVYLNEDCKKLLLSVRLLKFKMLDPDRSKKGLILFEPVAIFASIPSDAKTVKTNTRNIVEIILRPVCTYMASEIGD